MANTSDTMGMSGYGTRAEGTDKNAGSLFKFNAAPQSMVMSPQPASFKEDTGLGILSDTFGKLSASLAQWTQKQEDKNFLVGQMMAAQGKSVEEVRENGGQLAVSGFNEMKTELAASQFQDQAVQDISAGDYKLSPVQYQQKLAARYDTLTNNLPIGDTAALKTLTAQTSKMFPALVSLHTKANAQYVRQETADTAVKLLATKLNDPSTPDEQIEGFLAAGLNIPNEEDRHTAIANAYKSFSEFSPQAAERFKKIYGLPGYTPAGKDAEANVDLSSIVKSTLDVESFGGKQFNQDGTVVQNGEHYGAMQLSKAAAQDAADYLGIPLDFDKVKTDRNYNIKLGTTYMDMQYQRFKSWDKAVVAYNMGPTAVQDTIDKHGSAWREYLLEQPNGAQAVDYITKYEQTLGNLSPGAKAQYTDQDFILAAMNKGMNLEQATSMAAADKKQRDTNSNKFNADRVQAFDALVSAVRAGDETLAGGLKQVSVLNDTFKLTDHQMNALANELVTASHSNEAEQTALFTVKAARASNRVNELSGKQLRQAFDDEATSIQSKLATTLGSSGQVLSADQKASMLRTSLVKFIKDNANVVDPRIAERMQSAPSLDVLDHSGNINPLIKDSLDWYNTLYTNGGKMLADKYAGSASTFYETARDFATGTDLYSGLVPAKTQLTNDDAGIQRPTVLAEDIKTEISKAMDTSDANWFTGDRRQDDTVFQRFDSEVQRMKESPGFYSIVEKLAIAEKLNNPTNSKYVKTAVQQAMSGRVDFAMGNILLGSHTSTIAQDCDLPGYESTGAVERGLVQALKELGPKHFPKEWNEHGLFHPIDMIADHTRGVPEGVMSYDSLNKVFYFRPRIRTGVLGYTTADVAIPIPAKLVGAEFKAYNASSISPAPKFVAGILQVTETKPSTNTVEKLLGE